ncbi:hypothetical protein SAMN04489727_7808 [Amycolatopsis tolypomycina]|uniref:Uncharacterized protein n=1 Tax=Amycolatopsis tolypomycina TaxID=208445 RepID=A0A1H5AIM7_9PSEU|nr:hypothetical protein [Amycolatopsis tolypomycina]SED42266.1 hypothetical protein SAMN04489727_7808 [Amycolatopsis tolypomycina]
MPSTDPDDDRPVSATTNEVKDSWIGASVQARTIFGGVRVQQFTLSAIELVRACCVITMIVVAAISPWPWPIASIIGSCGALLFIAARKRQIWVRFTCATTSVALAASLFWLPLSRPEPADHTQALPFTPGISLQKVSHAFNPQFDRVALFLHNPAAEAVPIAEVSLYLDFDAKHWWHDPGDRQEWHFEVGREMFAGPANHEGATRLHGTVRAGDSQFDLPLVGQGFVTADGSWRRLLSFSPQIMVAAGQTAEVTIDIPVAFPVKLGTTGKLSEAQFDPAAGSLFTHVLVRTPNSAAHACDFVRQKPDPGLCDTVDPAAMVNAPR